MRLLAWFYRNWADTAEGFHPDLHPLLLPFAPATALLHIESVLAQLPRWRVESLDMVLGTIHATRRTRLCRFIDDVHIHLEDAKPGVRVHARSQSRLGKGDFGQNRRNLLELFRALERSCQASPCPPSSGS